MAKIKAKRGGTIKQYTEPAVTHNKPLVVTLEGLDAEGQPTGEEFIVKTSHDNLKEAFVNEELNNNYVFAPTRTPFDELKEMASPVNDDPDKKPAFRIKDTIIRKRLYPRALVVGLDKTRDRTNYDATQNTYWYENRASRAKATKINSQGVTITSASVWPLDARLDFSTTSSYTTGSWITTGPKDGAGELQNPYSIYGFSNRKAVQIGPGTSTGQNKYIDASVLMRVSGGINASGSSATYTVKNARQFSIFLWAKTEAQDETTGVNNRYLWSIFSGSESSQTHYSGSEITPSCQEILSLALDSNGYLDLRCTPSSSTASSGYFANGAVPVIGEHTQSTATSKINDGKWHHVGLVYSASYAHNIGISGNIGFSYRMYVDGQEVSRQQQTGSASGSSISPHLGYHTWIEKEHAAANSTRPTEHTYFWVGANCAWSGSVHESGDPIKTSGSWLGYLDELAVYHGALTPAQVIEVYNGGYPTDLMKLTQGNEHRSLGAATLSGDMDQYAEGVYAPSLYAWYKFNDVDNLIDRAGQERGNPHNARAHGLTSKNDVKYISDLPAVSQILPAATYARRVPETVNAWTSDTVTSSVPIFAGDTHWDAPQQANLVPYPAEYSKFSLDIRNKTQDYGIVPEFKISDHMEYYVVTKNGDFKAKKQDFLKIDGGSITSSTNTNFFKEFSNSDFLEIFNEGELPEQLDKPRSIALKCSAVKRLLPYDGFYPVNRTLQLASLFSQSYGASVEKYGPEPNFRTFLTPMFSPGIMYNTVKSGIAVDYPIHTSSWNRTTHAGVLPGREFSTRGVKFVNTNDLLVTFEDVSGTALQIWNGGITGKTGAERSSAGTSAGRVKVKFTGVPTNDQTITIKSTDGTTKAYIKKASQDLTTDPCQFHGASAAAVATSLAACIADAEGGHNGKITVSDDLAGNLTLTQATHGKAGNTEVTNGLSNCTVVGLDGSDTEDVADHFQGGDDTKLMGSTSGSVSLWMKKTRTHSNNYPRLFTIGGSPCMRVHWTPGGSERIIMTTYWAPESTHARTSKEHNTSGWTEIQQGVPWGSVPNVNDKWYHVVITYDVEKPSEAKPTMYINGVKYEGDDITGGHPPEGYVATATEEFFTIGNRDNSMGRDFPGIIDEVSVWRCKLTDADVANIYNAGTPNSLTGSRACTTYNDNDKNLVAWWRMGNGVWKNGDTISVADNNFVTNAGTGGDPHTKMVIHNVVANGALASKAGGACGAGSHLNAGTGSSPGGTYAWPSSITGTLVKGVHPGGGWYGPLFWSGSGLDPTAGAGIVSVTASEVGGRNHYNSLGDGGGFRVASLFGKRVPFEALVEPEDHLAQVSVVDQEPHPSASIASTASWNGRGDARYKLAMHNYLAESIDLFLEDGKLTTLVSKPEAEFGVARKGVSYVMDLALYRSQKPVRNDKGKLVYAKDSFDMYSRKSAFGPAVNDAHPDSDASYGFAPFTPPYYDGIAYARLVFEPEETKKYKLNDIMSQIQYSFYRGTGSFTSSIGGVPMPISQRFSAEEQAGNIISGSISWRDIKAGTSLAGYTGSTTVGVRPASVNTVDRMHVNASLNLFSKTKLKKVEYEATTGRPVRVTDDPDAELNVWTIQPKFETPILNFNSQSLSDRGLTVTVPTSSAGGRLQSRVFGGTGSVSYGMWHQYGTEPTARQGIFMRTLRAIDYKTGKAIRKTNTGKPIRSLSNLVGFKATPVKLGKIAEKREISEAVVAIPFVPSGPDGKKRAFIPISRQHIKDALGVERSARSIAKMPLAGESIRHMVETLPKYVMPPFMDFLGDSSIRPFVVYVFEFSEILDKEDLKNIWQNLSPKAANKISMDSSLINHDFDRSEFFGTFPTAHRASGGKKLTTFDDYAEQGMRWMVFKIKKKAHDNYFAKTSDSSDDARFKFDFDVGGRDGRREKAPVPYSYNWPYDFCSLVESIKLDTAITVGLDDEEEE